MKNVTEIKSLGDIRTSISTHIPTRQPQKGADHLNLYLLDMERQRLTKELYVGERRRKRILNRMAEIQRAMEALKAAKEQGNTAQPPSKGLAKNQEPAPGEYGCRLWKKVSVDY